MVKVAVEVALDKKHSEFEPAVRKIVKRKRKETRDELINLFRTRSPLG